jgi:urease accessory protein
MLDDLAFLRLQQLTDSALPVGAQAHSFGLEALIADGLLTVDGLEPFLVAYLQETGAADGYFCAAAYRLAAAPMPEPFIQEWIALNERLSAFRPARESRAASSALGRRLLTSVAKWKDDPDLSAGQQSAQRANVELHYVTVLGLTAGLLGLGERVTVLAYLQQTVMGLLTATQKLLPLGQSYVSQLLWRLKPVMVMTAECSTTSNWREGTVTATTPLLELASFRHARLPVRLFIS